MFESLSCQVLAKREQRNYKPGEVADLNWSALLVSIYRDTGSHSNEKMNVENKWAQKTGVSDGLEDGV